MSRPDDIAYLNSHLASIGAHARKARGHLERAGTLAGAAGTEEWLCALDEIVKVLNADGGIKARWERISREANE